MEQSRRAETPWRLLRGRALGHLPQRPEPPPGVSSPDVADQQRQSATRERDQAQAHGQRHGRDDRPTENSYTGSQSASS